MVLNFITLENLFYLFCLNFTYKTPSNQIIQNLDLFSKGKFFQRRKYNETFYIKITVDKFVQDTFECTGELGKCLILLGDKVLWLERELMFSDSSLSFSLFFSLQLFEFLPEKKISGHLQFDFAIVANQRRPIYYDFVCLIKASFSVLESSFLLNFGVK